MIEIRRVRLLQVPSWRASAWREAAAAACQAKGWTFHFQDRQDATPQIDPDRSSLIFGWIDHAPEGQVTDWLVQTTRPDDAATILAESLGLSDIDALHETSLRLASASTLVAAGAIVFKAEDAHLDIPGLGRVMLAADRERAETHSIERPLRIYDTLPPAHGATVSWSAALFRYGDPKAAEALDGHIDLIGRRRLLFNGPHIFLARGVWRFRATFSVRPADKADMLIEWGYGDRAVQIQKVFDQAGHYEIEMQQTWDEVAPADFRISVMTPVLDGGLEFHGGTLERLADALAPEPA